MTNPKILFLDIENCPNLAHVWDTGQQYVTHTQILDPSRIICIAYKFEGDREVKHFEWSKTQSDEQMLVKFSKIVEKADYVCGHNGRDFDMKIINTRLAAFGLPPLKSVLVEDSLKMSRKSFRLPSHSLAYLSKYFNVGKKIDTGGIDLWLKVWLKKDKKALERMVKYCKQDVLLLEKVYNRLKVYMKGAVINRAVCAENDKTCPNCGKIGLKDRGSTYTSPLRKVKRFVCKYCGKTCSDGKNLVAKTVTYPRG